MLRALIFTVLLLAAAAGGTWLLLVDAPPVDGQAVEFTISDGQPFLEVAAGLERDRLVNSAVRVDLLARITGMDRKIKAGTFRVERGTRPLRLLDDLAYGRALLRRLTVREGWRMDQIAQAVQDSLKVSAKDFEAAAHDSARCARVGTRGKNLEGYLFPDTYMFPDRVPAGDVVDKMLEHFEEVWRELPGAAAVASRDDVVTLASIVEAETPLSEERPRVAAVYLNRLALGMKLQADPTVRYGLGYFDEHLYFKQLDVDTPYNTYMHEGLPPGPIGSPGRESLQAALAPARPCDYLFFVASGQGGHVFSKTKEEHDRAHERARRAAKNASG